MAVIMPTRKDVSFSGDESCIQVIWTPVTEADTCQAVSLPQYPDRSIHCSGSFGGSTTAVQGSNNGGSTFCSLNDPSSTLIAITDNTKMKAVLENAILVRPSCSGGSAQSLTIAMLFRMGNPLRT